MDPREGSFALLVNGNESLGELMNPKISEQLPRRLCGGKTLTRDLNQFFIAADDIVGVKIL